MTQSEVVDLIQECYQFLAETVFCWAGQGSLQPNDTLHLLQYVSQGLEVGSDGALQPVSLCLLMALLAALDISPLQGQELPHHLFTLLHSPELLPQLQRKMAELTWQLPGLAAVVHLAWGLALSLLSQCSPSNSDILEGDEAMVDLAIKEDVFYHLKVLVVQCKAFRSEDFFVKQVHELITNFIVLMPHKVKELRANGDEVAKIVLAHYNEGINPPLNLSRHLEHLFNLVSSPVTQMEDCSPRTEQVTELYREDPLELCQAYWCPLDVTLDHKYQRQVALHKFVRISSDYLPAPLFVPYIDMLASLSNAPSSAHHCYTFLKLNSKNTPDHSTLISWDHIMDSLNHYFSSLRLEVEQRLHRPTMKGITIQEVARLKSVLRLLHVVVSKVVLYHGCWWSAEAAGPLGLLLGLLSCPVPPDLKASIFLALEAFAHLPGLNLNIFTGLEASKMELEELEARTEEFPMTRGFLTLLNTLVSQPLPPNMSMEPYLVFVCNHVLLRFETRSYTNAAEKMLIVFKQEVVGAVGGGQILPELPGQAGGARGSRPHRGVLQHHVPAAPGHQHPQDSLVHPPRGLPAAGFLHPCPWLGTGKGGVVPTVVLVMAGHQDLEQSLVLCLEVLHSALLQQGDFLQTLRESGMAGGVVTPLEDLLLVCNPETGFADYVPTMLRLAGLGGHTALASLRLLAAMAPRPSVAQHLADISSQETPRTCLHATLHAAHRPVLAPLAFQLLYRLAAGVKTSAPTLRYLRGSDFFPVHLQRLPFTSLPGSITTEEENLVAQAWFLKTLALEIKLACEGQHKSHLQRLISLLLAKHHSSVNHSNLPAVVQELENVMNYVKQINQARRYLSARVAAFEAWRQMTEITLGLSPPDVLADETRTFVVLDVAQELLDWLVREEIGELCTRGTGVVVTLLAVVYDRCTAESGTLLCLLHKLIDVLSHFIGGRERVKMHLYAAMLLLLLGPLRGVEALPSPEDKLGDIVCKDACRAFTVTRMLAVSLLDAGVSSPQWLTFLMGRGYLGHLATETCGPPLMNSLCSLFSKVASQGQGARAVLAAGLLPRLPDCSPPCLHLALSLASTLRPGHRQLLSQLCVYLTTQVEALSTALRSPATPPDHLALITSLLAYVSSIGSL
ncbi:NUP205 [Cordylochernes scorpioides]|uniref:NUP205 n=1 Tax=Cordylochernes scorpioides TaxID=51811 RepID=A0ABY6KHS5_9ARAC|nr:NUP205 [Cordylochernes scorpioides]